MAEFEGYSFSRLYKDENMEFFFILGVNDPDNFDEYWDGRFKEQLGYAVIYQDAETGKQNNYLYLIEQANRKYDDMVKYSKQFIQQMSLSEDLSDRENFEILKTEIKSRVLVFPYTELIKSVVKNEIPNFDPN